jgi:hypothetical protein
MENTIQVVDQEILDKFNVNIAYLKVTCKRCGSYWGVTVFDSKVPPRALVCERCAGNTVFHKNKDKKVTP